MLGAGGITGIAWLIGALEALEQHTGWDPGSAEVICGTSAGAVAATVVASGVEPMSLLRFADDPASLDAAIEAATAGRAPASRPCRGPVHLDSASAGSSPPTRTTA